MEAAICPLELANMEPLIEQEVAGAHQIVERVRLTQPHRHRLVPHSQMLVLALPS